jgi:hypothetical protein
MLRRILRILVPGAVLLGVVVLVRRTMSLRNEATLSPDPWTPIPTPREAVAAVQAPAAWVLTNEDGSCPPTHPIKAKASSHLYHLPGMFAYDRTNPDRCYAEEAAAIADGFTKAKR